jgi:exonuclease III
MPSFLFWNLNRGGLPKSVARLAQQESADVLILAECGMRWADILWELNAERSDYHFAPGNCAHLVFFTRFHPSLFSSRIESHRISIRALELPGRKPILVTAAHLPSKQDFSAESQVFESVHLARLIEDAEREEGHQRTIVMGDLNMNPFESGMVAASGGLNAVMSRRVAARHTRTVQTRPYKFFYNPMWRHLGDRGEAGGTYYYESSEPLCYFWNIFDQVLLRPELLHGFAHEQVRIVTEIGGASLLKDGCPDRELASDHLPVVLEMEF